MVFVRKMYLYRCGKCRVPLLDGYLRDVGRNEGWFVVCRSEITRKFGEPSTQDVTAPRVGDGGVSGRQ